MGDKVYKFSSDFKKLSEEDFINELRKRFKATKKEAKEVYDDLHGNSSGSPKKNKPPHKKGKAGIDSVPRTEKTEGDTPGHTEDKIEQGS